MEAARREAFQTLLQHERAALLKRLPPVTTSSGPLDARREVGTSQTPHERSRSTPIHGRTRQALDEIDAGLARLAAGSYGVCTACGREIAAARLAVVPATPHCLRCARRGPRGPHRLTRFAAALGKLFRR